MGFYGNITSVNKSTFQFDKIYANRFEMDANCENDGVFIGRFVLVDYDKGSSLSQGIDEEEAQKTKIIPAYMITDETGAISFHTGNSYTTPQFLLADTENCDVNDSAIEKDALILVLGRRRINMVIRDHTIYDSSQQDSEAMREIIANQGDYESMIPQLWKCTGAGRIVRFMRARVDENGDPVLDENNQPIIDTLTVTTAGFEKLAINYGTEDDTGIANDYNANYTTDMANYTNAGRGWDSTVWQKTWKDGKAKYVMIAELNSVVPTFDISVDAPTEVPLIPHWSEDSSNVYYKLHVQPQWGVRVKGQPSEFYTTDTKDYPSDVNGAFVIDSKLNGEVLQKIGMRIIVDKQGNPVLDEEGHYKLETYTIELTDKQEVTDDEFNAFPLAIYWNKAGFDPYQGSDAIKDMIIKKSLPGDSNHEAAAARFTGLVEENDGQDLDKWASKWTIKDSIAFKPSGLSRNTYNKHGGAGTLFDEQSLPDTYELSIMLPSLGQAMSDVWDIVYGKSSIADINGRTLWHKETGRFATKDLNQQMRNANYQWDTYNGERLVSELAPADERTKYTNGYLKYNKGLMTSLIANINSVHDLMGMIIRDYESNLNDVANWDPTKIYYVNGAYYRKNKTYTYTNVNARQGAEKDTYTAINNMISLDNTNDPIYRIDLGEFQSFEDPELESISNTKFTNYRLASGKEDYIEGAKYVRLTPGAEAKLSAEGYEPNQYFIKKTTQPTIVYELDRGNTPNVEAGGNYYKITAKQCTGFEFYVPYRYWMLNTVTKEVVFCTAASLAGVLGKDKSNHDIIDSATVTNVKFYRNANITPNENESIAETRYVRKRVEPPVVIKEITAVPEDTSRYKYELNQSDNKKYLYILATDGVTVIETIPSEDITSINAETKLPENYYAPKYEVASSGNYSTLTVWARELINNKLPQDSPDLIKWKYDNGGNKIPEYQYYYVAADDTFSLEGKEEVRVRDFDNKQPYFIGSKAQIDGENKFIRFAQETITNLRGTTYGLQRNTLDPATNTIQYYTLELKDQQAFYNLKGNFYYQNADKDWLRETLPKAAVNGAPAWSSSQTYNYNDEVKYDNLLYCDIIYRSLKGGNIGVTPGTDSSKWEEVRRIPNYYGAPTATPVNERIFIPNYFYKLVNGKYVLADTFENNTTYYELTGKYVSADTNKIYDTGAKWNPEVPIPSGVTLATRKVAWKAEKLEGFAQNLNTIHGLILKINNKLLTDDKLTRDRNTVQGTLNVLNDILDKFHTLVPTEIVMVDDYGRIHSGDTDTIQSGTFENIGTTATGNITAVKNAWIKITNSIGTDHKPHIKLEHQLLHKKSPTTTVADKNTGITPQNKIAGLNQSVGDTIDLYTPIVDSMGHVIGKNTETVTLPYGFKTITTNGSSTTADDDLSGDATASVVADNTQDTLALNTYNKWIQVATNAGVDEIDFAHKLSTFTPTASSANFNNAGTTTFKIPTYSYDGAGHITGLDTKTLTMANGFKTVHVSNNGTAGSDLIAANPIDAFSITTGDRWTNITSDASKKTISLTHNGPSATKTYSAGQTSNTAPAFGSTFVVMSASADERGHINGMASHTVTIPKPSLSTASSDQIVTGISLTPTTGAFTYTKANVGTFVLTGYSLPTDGSADITAKDTLNAALGKLQYQTNALESLVGSTSVSTQISNAIGALDAAGATAGNTQILNSVSETNGKISASAVALGDKQIASGKTTRTLTTMLGNIISLERLVGATGVSTQISNAIGNLDADAVTATDYQVINSVSETNGKISATASSISSKSVTDGTNTATLADMLTRIKALEDKIAKLEKAGQ